LAAWNKGAGFHEIHMPGCLPKLNEAMSRIIRHCCSALGRVVPYLTYLSIALTCINRYGLRIAGCSAALVIGNMLLVRCCIHSIAKPRFSQPARDVLSRLFVRFSPGLGFSLLVFLSVIAILAEVMLVRDFVSPANSWVFITLGFLYGIMGPVMAGLDRRSKRGGQCDVPMDLEPMVWVRYDPLVARGTHQKG
jgi:hypothetical protein